MGAAFVGAVVFLGLALIFLYFLSPFAETTNNLQLLSIGLSFITSVLLIGIYGVLAVRQGNQNELQEGQQRLMEASHEPLLQVLDVDSYSEFIWPKMRNIGNGPTKDMRAAIHFYHEPRDLKVDTEEAPLTHSADSEAIDVPAGEAAEIGSLSPQETGKLAAELRTPRLDGDDSPGPMGYLMNDFDERGIEEVVYQIEILYDHLMRTKGTGRHYLKLREVEVQRSLSVDSLIQHGEVIQHREEITAAELIEEADNFSVPGTYYDDIEDQSL